MISCKLYGGLGNYLFQIGAMYSLSDDVGFDIKKTYQVHNNITTYLPNILRKINFTSVSISNVYSEPQFSYTPLPTGDNILFDGYFQSEKYLDRELILDLYSIDKDSFNYINPKYSNILTNSVSVHVRRGNYLTRQDRHPVQNINYYNTALAEFTGCDNILVFSDDIKWCKENFIGSKFTFIEGEADYIDLWLMSLCNHNIIANSSFSWWGAWLNQNPSKKVIAPKIWFGPNKKLNTKDIIPLNWQTI